MIGPAYEQAFSELAVGYEHSDTGSFGGAEYLHSYDDDGYNSVVVDFGDRAMTLTVTTGEPSVVRSLAESAASRVE